MGLGHPEFIPEVHTILYFLLSVKRWGFWGIAVIMLFMILVYRIQDRAVSTASFSALLRWDHDDVWISGFYHPWRGDEDDPLTGVTLPFVSYGGSSLISSFVSLGILQVASEELDGEQEEEHGY